MGWLRVARDAWREVRREKYRFYIKVQAAGAGAAAGAAGGNRPSDVYPVHQSLRSVSESLESLNHRGTAGCYSAASLFTVFLHFTRLIDTLLHLMGDCTALPHCAFWNLMHYCIGLICTDKHSITLGPVSPVIQRSEHGMENIL